MTKPITLKEYCDREDRLENLEITRLFLLANLRMNECNPAMVSEFEQKLAETEKEISKLIEEA